MEIYQTESYYRYCQNRVLFQLENPNIVVHAAFVRTCTSTYAGCLWQDMQVPPSQLLGMRKSEWLAGLSVGTIIRGAWVWVPVCAISKIAAVTDSDTLIV